MDMGTDNKPSNMKRMKSHNLDAFRPQPKNADTADIHQSWEAKRIEIDCSVGVRLAILVMLNSKWNVITKLWEEIMKDRASAKRKE